MKKFFTYFFYLALYASSDESKSFLSKGSSSVDNSCNLHFEASYLLYQVQEDGLEIASNVNVVQQPNLQYAPVSAAVGVLTKQPHQFNSGFFLKLGGEVNEWILDISYLWMQTANRKYITQPESTIGEPGLITRNWYQAVSSTQSALIAQEMSTFWSCKINFLDLTLSRPFYIFSDYIFNPYMGLRSGFIYQKFNVELIEAPNTVFVLPTSPVTSHNYSSSWGVGPRLGFENHILLPKKFKILTDLGLSLLYTQYDIFHNETAADLYQIPQKISYDVRNEGYLREVLELGLGFGWGDYIRANKNYLQANIMFDFFKLYNQNMLKKTIDGFVNQVGSPGLDLYMYGMSFNFSIDF